MDKPIRISCSSILKAQENINNKWTQLIEQGYLLTSVDSVVKVDSANLIAYFSKATSSITRK